MRLITVFPFTIRVLRIIFLTAFGLFTAFLTSALLLAGLRKQEENPPLPPDNPPQ